MRGILRESWSKWGRKRYLDEKRKVRRRIAKGGILGMHAVSGKSYIFPMVFKRCQQAVKLRDTSEGLKVRLSRHCRLNADAGVARAVRRALRSGDRA